LLVVGWKNPKMKLTVHQAKLDDVYQNIVRVHRSHRIGVRVGRLCRVSANGKTIVAIARNSAGDTDGIWLDSSQRFELDVKAGEEADFNIVGAPWYHEFLWVWRASDPVNRTAGRLGLLSLGLGIIGIILGIWSVFLAFK
jgi:hypothetical protein